MTVFEAPIKTVGKDVTFETGAKRDHKGGKGRFDLIPWDAIEEIAKHFEKGGVHHGDRNWEKGIPLSSYADSGMRHGGQTIQGKTDEPHPVAAAWNWLCFIATKLRIERGLLPETLDDLPKYVVGGDLSDINAAAAYEAKAKQVYGANLSEPFIDEASLGDNDNNFTPPVQGHGNPEANENIHVEETTAQQARHEDPHHDDAVVPHIRDGLYRWKGGAYGDVIVLDGKYVGCLRDADGVIEPPAHRLEIEAQIRNGDYRQVRQF